MSALHSRFAVSPVCLTKDSATQAKVEFVLASVRSAERERDLAAANHDTEVEAAFEETAELRRRLAQRLQARSR